MQTPTPQEDKPYPEVAAAQTVEQLENSHRSVISASPDSIKKAALNDVFGKFLILEGWSHWFFRLGFASIFFVNATYAAFEPQSFTDLLRANPVANLLGNAELLVKIAIFNDLLLCVFMIGGWRKQLVYAWAGGWLLLVAGLKIMNLAV